MAGQTDKRLAELGVTLPTPAAPVANYVPAVVTGKQLFISGQLPMKDGKVTLTGIAGLIWSQRRKFEKRLTVRDVMKLVSMATLETMELHDPEDEGETAIEDMTPDDPRRKLAEMARGRRSDTEQGLPGFGEPTSSSGHDSGPSTD